MATKKVKKEVKENAISTKGREFSGVVTSDKMKDTVVVTISRFIKHPKYGKFLKINKKYKADDKGNTKKIGDKVTIKECAPISKDKHFKII